MVASNRRTRSSYVSPSISDAVDGRSSVLMWSNSSQSASSATAASQPAAPTAPSAVCRCRSIEPRTTRSGRTPRAASAAPSTRDCSSPTDESRS